MYIRRLPLARGSQAAGNMVQPTITCLSASMFYVACCMVCRIHRTGCRIVLWEQSVCPLLARSSQFWVSPASQLAVCSQQPATSSQQPAAFSLQPGQGGRRQGAKPLNPPRRCKAPATRCVGRRSLLKALLPATKICPKTLVQTLCR